MKILVVDDSSMIREIIKSELEEGGYNVVEAVNGIEALIQITKSSPPDLITLDIEMPKLNGFDTCQKTREKHYAHFFTNYKYSQVPIIFVTSKDTMEDRKKGFLLGAADFIVKPFDKGEILRIVNKILKPENFLKGITALVVDDSKIAREIVSELLQREGLTVIEAKDGIQAYEIICNRMLEIDIVLTDFLMPLMNGSELCSKIRKDLNLRDLPVILLTAMNEHSCLLNLFKAGATDYIVKPFVKEELLARINVHLQRTLLNKRLKQTVIELKKLNRMKDDLMAVCSHDLRSPLNGILGFTELLLEKKHIAAEDQQSLFQIKKSGEILLNFINDLLDVSKIKSGRFEIKMEPVSVLEVVNVSINALKHLSDHKQQQLELINNFPDNTILGNHVDLIRVINNLLSNAIKFTPTKGQIKLVIEPDAANYIKISVIDSGIGISEDIIPHLFDKFTNTTQDGTNGEKGTGLGLSIVKEIIEQHDGRLNVSSTKGRGSCFEIIFPLAAEAEKEVSHALENNTGLMEKHSAPVETEHAKTCNILMAEDNPINIMLVKKILQSAGHNITVVENGSIALETSQKGDFDIILMDIQMPEMDGLKATKAIRNSGMHDIPIIALTGNTSQDNIDTYLNVGMNDFLGKPFDPKDLHAKIDKWCFKRKKS
ncbi:MAG: response regulator [Desulfobacteraceae bacterium]|nr:response regulator [Desulfobacteraceae bacterium]MBC2719484.1 response regulator [Desulfobacteraceae bacterium]